MRKIALWITGLVATALLLISYGAPLTQAAINHVYYSPCDTPIQYKIGSVDPRFKLTKEEFAKDVEEAIAIWANTEQKQLFLLDEKAQLSINLTFDNRQSLNDQINSLQKELNSQKNTIEPQTQAYNRLSAEFKKRLEDFKTEVDFWNNKGGAPPDEYHRLEEERNALQEEATKLNALAKSLNQSTDVYNTEVGNLNQTVDTYKEALAQKPEEGVYDGKNQRIDIYFNINNNELIHTLSHELGHALGLKHVRNPQAIMYAYTSQEISPVIEEITALQEICRKRTIFETAGEVAQFYIKLLQTRMNSSSS